MEKQLFGGVRYLELTDGTCSLRSLGVASITYYGRFLYSYSKTLDEESKLLDHCTFTSETEQNDMKSGSKCLCGFELHGCVKKEGRFFFVSSGSVCKLPFFVCMDRLLSVKSPVEHNNKGYKT